MGIKHHLEYRGKPYIADCNRFEDGWVAVIEYQSNECCVGESPNTLRQAIENAQEALSVALSLEVK